MTLDGHRKVAEGHLRRDAYLYVRQSTLRQVLENTESTKRQYALRQQAVRLGWPTERIIVIDGDLGRSGATADRDGFQRLVAEVGMGCAGIVLGLEVSRLARNNADWHRLLEICALTETLILDEDGLYDPRHFNDRLLLGMKGSFSEAELHIIRARLQGGIQAKARRGELKKPLPVGLIHNQDACVVFDPDQQVQQALHTFFAAYERVGSATATVRHFNNQGLLFPRRLRHGPRKGQLLWGRLVHSRALQVLKNPWYAGTYVHGRTKVRKKPNGKLDFHRLPQDHWDTVLPGTHRGYITWEQYQRNQRRLRDCAQAHGGDRRKSPPREGPALLQGLAVCGICGQRMTVRYQTYRGQLRPVYVCQRDGIERGESPCQIVPGAAIDEQISELLLQMVEPLTLDVALAVQGELEGRLDDADRLRRRQVERARYEAELARERYMTVDPRNRLVADALEADWNDKLRALEQVQQDYEQKRQADHALLSTEAREKVLALATTFPRVWRDPATPPRQRKRMTQLLIEDVTLVKDDHIRLHIRFKGGTAQTQLLPLPAPAWKSWETDPHVVTVIDQLLDQYTEAQIAAKLNQDGHRSGKGNEFTRVAIQNIRNSHRLRSRFDRLRDKGLLTQEELAIQLHVAPKTVARWRHHGMLACIRYNDKDQYLYEPLSGRQPVRSQGIKLTDPRRWQEVVPNEHKGV